MTHPIIKTHTDAASTRIANAERQLYAAEQTAERLDAFGVAVSALLTQITTALPADLRAEVEAGAQTLPESVAALAARVAAPTPTPTPTPALVTFAGIPGEWIPWAGGECPVGGDMAVEVVCRFEVDESDWRSYPRTRDGWEWSHTGDPGDILGYRIVSESEDDAEPEAEPDADAEGWYTHDGTAWPVCGLGDEVEYGRRGGSVGTLDADSLCWRHDGDGSDIIRYRPLPKT